MSLSSLFLLFVGIHRSRRDIFVEKDEPLFILFYKSLNIIHVTVLKLSTPRSPL
jgi:hypothetical protein